MTQEPVQVQPARSSPGVLAFTGPGALAPTQSLRGTQMLAATIQAPVDLGYYFALAVEASQSAAKEIYDGIASYGEELFFTVMESAYAALGLVRPGPQARLDFYQTVKTPAMWDEQKQKYPNDYFEDRDDYDRLLVRQQEGTLG